MNGLSTTFLLGAGATRGALKGFNLNGHRILAPLNGDFLKVVSNFVAALNNSGPKNRLERIKSFMHDRIGIAKGRQNVQTMEQIFSMLYIAKDFMEIYKERRGRRAQKLQEIDDFLILMMRLFSEISKHAARSESFNIYRKFVNILGPNDTIITLNYDTLLDRELLSRGWNPQTGYCISLSPHLFRGLPRTRVPNSQVASIKLIKLHGSFNWLIKKKKDENLSVLFSKKPTRIYSPDNPRVGNWSGYARQIIPPVYGKFFSHSFWRSLWAKAFDSLMESDQLVVVGCSLTPSDFHVRGLLGRVKSLRRANGNKFANVIVVDPSKNQEPQKAFKMILKGSIGNFSSISNFERFLKAYTSQS